VVGYFLGAIGVGFFGLLLELIAGACACACANGATNDSTRWAGDRPAHRGTAKGPSGSAGTRALGFVAFSRLAGNRPAGRADGTADYGPDRATHHPANDCSADGAARAANCLAGVLLIIRSGALSLVDLGVIFDDVISPCVVHGFSLTN
jgi:hypothetical protein